mgnify:CR=1 FL=1
MFQRGKLSFRFLSAGMSFLRAWLRLSGHDGRLSRSSFRRWSFSAVRTSTAGAGLGRFLMALAPWVAGLDDFASWIRRVIDDSAVNWFANARSNAQTSRGHARSGRQRRAASHGFVVEDHRIEFPDPARHFLDFSFEMVWTPDVFEYGEYNYDFRQGDGVLVWRYDKHPGHPDIGDTHVHLGPDERPSPCGRLTSMMW